jgi:hypothetical protein
MYSLLYFISHPIDVSNVMISGLIDWIKEYVHYTDWYSDDLCHEVPEDT